MRVLNLATGQITSIADAAAALGVQPADVRRLVDDPFSQFVGVEEQQTRLQNLPLNIHQEIQRRVRNVRGRPNHRALAALTVAGHGVIPRTISDPMTGLRNACALVKAIVDVYRQRIVQPRRNTTLQQDLAAVSDRFGVPALGVVDVQQPRTSQWLHQQVIHHGVLERPGTAGHFPRVDFASSTSPMAVAVQFAIRRGMNPEAAARYTILWRTKDLIFQFRWTLNYAINLATGQPRYYEWWPHVEISHLVLKRADVELCRALFEALHDSLVGVPQAFLERQFRTRCVARVLRKPAEARVLADALGVQAARPSQNNPLSKFQFLP